jgi:hypothetical protein
VEANLRALVLLSKTFVNALIPSGKWMHSGVPNLSAASLNVLLTRPTTNIITAYNFENSVTYFIRCNAPGLKSHNSTLNFPLVSKNIAGKKFASLR